MRKLLFFFAFILAAGTMSAQKSCSKKCAKTCTKAEAAACKKAGVTCIIMEDGSTTSVASAMAAAELAAETNTDIEKAVCSKSGKVSFYQKSVCSKSGKVSKEEVLYDVKSSSFVNVSPKDMVQQQEGKVVKASSETKGAAKKACSKSGKKCCASKKVGA